MKILQICNATQNEECLQINIEESTSELCSYPSGKQLMI